MRALPKILLTAVLAAALCMAGSRAATAQEKSLYDRLGGIVGIAAVVDDFVNNLVKNKVVTSNPKVVAALGPNLIKVPSLKFLLTEQLAAAAGGPQKYSGRSMLEAHAGMGITEEQWAATLETLQKSMNKFKVPRREQGEVIAAIAPTKGDIVGK